MTNPEIEKLAIEYANLFITHPRKELETWQVGIADNFKAGYLKGVEAERKRCLDIIIEEKNYYNDLDDDGDYRHRVQIDTLREVIEQIERGDK